MTATRTFALLLVTTAALGAAHDARAQVLCTKRSGQVVARTACKGRERPIDAAAVGLVGPAGADGVPGPAGSPGGHPYRIVDAQGRPFGLLLGADFGRARAEVTLPDGTPVQFVVDPGGGFSPEIGPYVFYEQAGCSGPPFVFGSVGLVPPVVVVGTVGYYATAAPELVAVGSFESPPSGSCSSGSVATDRETCCSDMTSSLLGAPAKTVAIATLGVTPPFMVQR